MRSVLKYGALALLSATLASPVALAQMSGNNGQPGGTASGQSNDQATHNGWSQNSGAGKSDQTGSKGSQAASSQNDQGMQTDNKAFVTEVQEKLQQQGFYKNAKIDGIWGPDTENALRDFQKQHNLPATGRLDTATIQALNLTGNSTSYGMNSNNGGSGGQGNTGTSTGNSLGNNPAAARAGGSSGTNGTGSNQSH